ncbi:MAG: hypothetical protein K9M96_16515 [Deltaproteobacteria bacterium]|nr:hypothetical protein [Deltaproteobacteria bacterium]
MPPGHTLEFIVEKEKLKNIRKVVSHNRGKVISEASVDGDVQFKVTKIEDNGESR